MNESEEKLIQDRKNKVHEAFGDKANLYKYLFDTLDNFYYRYFEKELKTGELAPKTFGVYSEVPMLEALKKPHVDAKAGIIQLAKENRNATVRLGLWAQITELTQDDGEMKIVSEINWGHPEYQDPSKIIQKVVKFKYDELQKFRKELALKLEEAAELFL